MTVTGVDFVSVPTQDLERAVEFYGETLGLERSVYKPERNFAEFETGTVTLSVVNPEKMGIGEFKANANHLALHVEDVAAAREALEARGVSVHGDILDTGVCHMAIFSDPDGNALMLHRRYLAIWWSDHPDVPREQIVATALNMMGVGLDRLRRGETWDG